MRLHIRHQTAYRYSQPIAYAIQTLRLTPQPYEGLNVIHWRVRGESRHALSSFVDGYGNITHCHTVNHRHEAAAISVEGDVETRGGGDATVRGAPEPLPPFFFLRETPLTAVTPAIAALAGEDARGRTPLDRLMALMAAVRERVEYRAGVTYTETTAAQALAGGAGVCQDHAHLLIAAARHLGFPARYVGGYLWTGAEAAEYDANHAWAEIFVADIGWVGFDPANRARPNESYVRASIGLDYGSAAPVRGIRRGDAEETLAVKVSVLQARADQ